jgi:hypothetical protein
MNPLSGLRHPMTALHKPETLLHPLTCCCEIMAKDLDRLPHRAMSLYRLQARAYRSYRLQHPKTKNPQLSSKAAASGRVAVPSQQLARPKKSVTFAPKVSVVSIVTTPADLSNAWYGRDEYRQFEASRRRTISEIGSANGNLSLLDPAEHCVLGLEEQLSREQVLVRRLKTSHYTSDIHALASMLSRHASNRAQWRAVSGRADVAYA